MIADSVAYLLKHFEEVIYDAEHFFDGFKRNPDYAMRTLLAAEAAGAHCLVLCDTNGGSLPHEVAAIIQTVKRAREAGDAARHPRAQRHRVRGGELAGRGRARASGTCRARSTATGSAAATPTWSRSSRTCMLKMGLDCIPRANLRELRDVSRLVSELANRKPWSSQPYVGDSAFAHKGGIHVSAVLKHPETYEHIDPDAVGNQRAGAGLRAGRAVERALEGQGVRHRPRQEHARGPAHPRDAQAARGRGVPVRGRGGLVRAARWSARSATTGPTSSWAATG